MAHSPVWHDYDYAVLRLVPDVRAEAFVNVGLVLHSRTARCLRLRVALPEACPGLDRACLVQMADGLAAVGEGGAAGGPLGALPPSERFHWLTAVRSTVLQPSPVRGGRTDALDAAFDRLFATYVER